MGFVEFKCKILLYVVERKLTLAMHMYSDLEQVKHEKSDKDRFK